MKIPTLIKACAIAFASSFCVMVIELIAARVLAPFIGVSLYTWTSIIGVILAGIALGNYLGGKVADRSASPTLLALIFLAGALATIGILPATKAVSYIGFSGPLGWIGSVPWLLGLVARIAIVFFVPAVILSMVSPMVIKLTLADLGRTGGVVGTIYAWSTVGSILGTFMTGFFFIMWFGTRAIVWLVAAGLILISILAWFSWKVPDRWHIRIKNLLTWTGIIGVIVASIVLFQNRSDWEESFTRESNYYTIRVYNQGDIKVLALDRLIHSYVDPQDPLSLKYDYLKMFGEIAAYRSRGNPAPRLLHMGGGGYSFPRYMDTVYPASVNEVVEIDPVVTEVVYQEMGLPRTTRVKTYNQDARLFLIQQDGATKYDFIVGDVFNDTSTPFHLTTLELDQLLKANLKPDGIYMVNIIDDFTRGRYMASHIYTLRQAFKYVYLFKPGPGWENIGRGTFVIAATERPIDLADLAAFSRNSGTGPIGYPLDEKLLDQYIAGKDPVLLTDDHAPTDILVAPLFN